MVILMCSTAIVIMVSLNVKKHLVLKRQAFPFPASPRGQPRVTVQDNGRRENNSKIGRITETSARNKIQEICGVL
jgi:hypothetical protein